MTSALPASRLWPWLLALRPKTLTAAVVPVLVGTALAAQETQTTIWWVTLCTVTSSLFIQIGTNLVNDALDFKKGADTNERLGPTRVTQSQMLSGQTVLYGALICFALAAICGLPLIWRGGLPILLIGILSLLFAYGYTGGPFPLAYHGLGEVFVILFFGLISVGGTFFLHTLKLTNSALIAGLQVGLLATVLIAINNLRDIEQDRLVNKRTLAVRFGINAARLEILAAASIPLALNVYWYIRGLYGPALLPLLSAPLAALLISGVFRHRPSPRYNKFLALGAALQLLFGVLFSAALFMN